MNGRDGGVADARRPIAPIADTGPGTSVDSTLPGVEAGPGDAQVPGAVSDAQVDTGTPTTVVPPPGTKGVFVAVGYSGVRLRSLDGGKTWVDSVTSGGNGDDVNLLRTVTFGNGLFVAAGWKIWTSADGAKWDERKNPASQWMGGLEYGNALFVGAGGSGTSIYSSTGIEWMAGKNRNNEPARAVAFGNAMFVAGTDQNNWWSTANGASWSVLSGGHGTSQVMWCKDRFAPPSQCQDPLARNNGHTAFGDGVYVSAAEGKIERSEDGGKTWTVAKETKDNPVTDVAFGLVP